MLAAVVGTLVHESWTAPATTDDAGGRSASATVPAPPTGRAGRSGHAPSPPAPPRGDTLPDARRGALGAADGVVPGGVTVSDDVPAVTHLDPELRKALRRAATDAGDDGVTLYVNSGWRSRRYQDQLLREAVSRYGSEEEAARWVATADTSPHVSGNAIDVGHAAAAAWLARHGAEYGLCPIYRNEPWHYELRPDAATDGCPPRYADPTHDPRMQK